MKIRCEFITGILALLSPIFTVVVMLFIEPELIEAVVSGIVVGCIIGSVFGAVSLMINISQSKTVKVLSVIPMCLLALYLLMHITYLA